MEEDNDAINTLMSEITRLDNESMAAEAAQLERDHLIEEAEMNISLAEQSAVSMPPIGTTIIGMPTDIPIISSDPLVLNTSEFITTEIAEIVTVAPKKRKKKISAKVSKPKEPSTFVKKVVEIVSLSFDQKDFDICEINSAHGAYGLMLRWPFLEMNNKYGKKHSIKDMLVGLPFEVGSLSEITNASAFGGGINGGRGTVSLAEQVSGYRHSHLRRRKDYMSVFCTGVDDINVSWTDLKMMNVEQEDFDMKLEAFLHQLTAFLRYESIEGTPYVRFSNISLGGVSSYTTHDAYRQGNHYVNTFDYDAIKLSMDFTAGDVELIESDEFHSDLASRVDKHQKRLSNGSYVDIDSEQDSNIMTGDFYVENSVYHLHGRNQIYVEPIGLVIPEGNNFKKYAHKLIIDDVRNRFKDEGTRIIREFCQGKRVRNKYEEEGASSDWPIFDGGHTLLPVETT